VFAFDGAVHFHGWCLTVNRLLTINLQHVTELRLLDEVVARPASYRPEDVEQSTFSLEDGEASQRFVLQFDALAAGRIAERQWHPTQTIRLHRNGGLELSFRCAQTRDLVQWICSWIHHVEVIEPVSLREQLGELGKSLRRRYSAPCVCGCDAETG
jgi:predicted DNA-binding transcriptional regulator YafY